MVAKVSVSLDATLLEWLNENVGPGRQWSTRSEAVSDAIAAIRRQSIQKSVWRGIGALKDEDVIEAQSLCAGDPLTDFDGEPLKTDAEIREFYAAAGVTWEPGEVPRFAGDVEEDEESEEVEP